MQTRKSQTAAIQSSNKKQIISSVIGVLAALFLLGWGVQRLMASRQLAKVKDMGENIFEQTKDLPPEDRQAKWQEYRAEIDKLRPEQRQQLETERLARFQKREKEKLDKFFQAAPKEQLEMLDNDIKREEEFRKRMEQMMQGGGGGWGGFGGGGRGAGGPGGVGGNNGGGGGGDRRSRSSPEDRENMRKRMLDSSSPEFRAQTTEYRMQMRKRREALGLPPSPWGGGGPGGGMPKGGAPKGGAPKAGGV